MVPSPFTFRLRLYLLLLFFFAAEEQATIRCSTKTRKIIAFGLYILKGLEVKKKTSR